MGNTFLNKREISNDVKVEVTTEVARPTPYSNSMWGSEKWMFTLKKNRWMFLYGMRKIFHIEKNRWEHNKRPNTEWSNKTTAQDRAYIRWNSSRIAKVVSAHLPDGRGKNQKGGFTKPMCKEEIKAECQRELWWHSMARY